MVLRLINVRLNPVRFPNFQLILLYNDYFFLLHFMDRFDVLRVGLVDLQELVELVELLLVLALVFILTLKGNFWENNATILFFQLFRHVFTRQNSVYKLLQRTR